VTSPNPAGGVTELAVDGVAATSARNAWAVGTYNTSSAQRTVILHWNGRAWKLVPNPSPGPEPGLSGVAATSAGNIWAVGDFVTSNNSPQQVLALHCC
jgi:hypothetical protein